MPAEAPPLLLLRGDAGPGIGSGHAARLLSIAESWIDAGGRALLLTVAPSPALKVRAGLQGVEVRELQAAHPHPGDIADAAVAVSEAPRGTWVAVDGYSFDAAYLSALRAAGARVLRVDDGPRGEVPCDAFLDQNPGAETGAPLLPPGALPLLGPRWALLRSSFARAGAKREAPGEARRLLISFGGWDPGDATGLALRALRRVKSPFEAVVVVGPDNPRAGALAKLAEGLPVRLERTADMPVLMAKADLALIGGGVTMLEACAAGLPAVVVPIAENQEPGAAAMARRGLVRSPGRARELDEDALAGALDELLRDAPELARLSAASRAAVDGRGAERVGAALLALSEPRLPADLARLRPARPEDSREIWRIANDPAVRSNSFQTEPIPWETHERWFSSRLADASESFQVVDLGCVAGHVRLTPFSPGALEVHFYVHPAFRGKGLGKLLLESAQRTAFAREGIDELVGTVLPGNEASVKSFLSSGFAAAGETRHGSRTGLLFRSRRAARAAANKRTEDSDAK